jgi:hypothetical protein
MCGLVTVNDGVANVDAPLWRSGGVTMEKPSGGQFFSGQHCDSVCLAASTMVCTSSLPGSASVLFATEDGTAASSGGGEAYSARYGTLPITKEQSQATTFDVIVTPTQSVDGDEYTEFSLTASARSH